MKRTPKTVPLALGGVRSRHPAPRYYADKKIKRLAPTDAQRRALAIRAGMVPGQPSHPIPCSYCGRLGVGKWPRRPDGQPGRSVLFEGLVIDHIYPYSKGGSRCTLNLTLACGDCNSRKGTLLLSEWMVPV